MNGHVNNTRYAQWRLDSIPPEHLATWEVAEYEMNFLTETNVGDTVAIECVELPAEPDSCAGGSFRAGVPPTANWPSPPASACAKRNNLNCHDRPRVENARLGVETTTRCVHTLQSATKRR
jgi:hypothetical protein